MEKACTTIATSNAFLGRCLSVLRMVFVVSICSQHVSQPDDNVLSNVHSVKSLSLALVASCASVSCQDAFPRAIHLCRPWLKILLKCMRPTLSDPFCTRYCVVSLYCVFVFIQIVSTHRNPGEEQVSNFVTAY
jgi:hypothetical protein